MGQMMWGANEAEIFAIDLPNSQGNSNLQSIGMTFSLATYLELLSRHPSNKDGFFVDYHQGWQSGYCADTSQGIVDCSQTITTPPASCITGNQFIGCGSAPCIPHVGPAGYSFRVKVTGAPPNQGLKIFDITTDRLNPQQPSDLDNQLLPTLASGQTHWLTSGTKGDRATKGYFYYNWTGLPDNPVDLYYCTSSSATFPVGSGGLQGGWLKLIGYPFATPVSWEKAVTGTENFDGDPLGSTGAKSDSGSYITVAANGATLAGVTPPNPQPWTRALLYPLNPTTAGGPQPYSTTPAIANWTDILCVTGAAGAGFPRHYVPQSGWLSRWAQSCTATLMEQAMFGLDEAVQIHNWPGSQTNGPNNPLQYAGRTGIWTQQFISGIMMTLASAISYGMLPTDPTEHWPPVNGEGTGYLFQFYKFTNIYTPTDVPVHVTKPVFKENGGIPYVSILQQEQVTGPNSLPLYLVGFGDHWAQGDARVLFTLGTTINSNRWILSPDHQSTISSDLNGSGCVDSNDLTLLLAGWGAPCGKVGCEEDLNDDGLVDGADVAVLFGEWGLGCGGSP